MIRQWARGVGMAAEAGRAHLDRTNRAKESAATGSFAAQLRHPSPQPAMSASRRLC